MYAMPVVLDFAFMELVFMNMPYALLPEGDKKKLIEITSNQLIMSQVFATKVRILDVFLFNNPILLDLMSHEMKSIQNGSYAPFLMGFRNELFEIMCREHDPEPSFTKTFTNVSADTPNVNATSSGIAIQEEDSLREITSFLDETTSIRSCIRHQDTSISGKLFGKRIHEHYTDTLNNQAQNAIAKNLVNYSGLGGTLKGRDLDDILLEVKPRRALTLLQIAEKIRPVLLSSKDEDLTNFIRNPYVSIIMTIPIGNRKEIRDLLLTLTLIYNANLAESYHSKLLWPLVPKSSSFSYAYEASKKKTRLEANSASRTLSTRILLPSMSTLVHCIKNNGIGRIREMGREYFDFLSCFENHTANEPMSSMDYVQFKIALRNYVDNINKLCGVSGKSKMVAKVLGVAVKATSGLSASVPAETIEGLTKQKKYYMFDLDS